MSLLVKFETSFLSYLITMQKKMSIATNCIKYNVVLYEFLFERAVAKIWAVTYTTAIDTKMMDIFFILLSIWDSSSSISISFFYFIRARVSFS